MFTDRGYTNPTLAVADLLGCDRADARRITTAAAHVHGRTGLDGTELPATLPGTAARFAAGDIDLEHVHVVAAVLNTGAARRSTRRSWPPPSRRSPTRPASTPPPNCAPGPPA